MYLLLLAMPAVFGADKNWSKQDGKFAVFEAPPGMIGGRAGMGVDTIQQYYHSPEITFGFDSEASTLPQPLQKELERTIAVWTAQRIHDWAQSTYVEEGGAIHGDADDKDAIKWYNMRYYLYFGFAVPEGNFSLHIRFNNLDRLDDIERMLKSIRLKTKKA